MKIREKETVAGIEVSNKENIIAQSAGVVEYTDCFFTEGNNPPPTTVQDMTLNNLTVGQQ